GFWAARASRPRRQRPGQHLNSGHQEIPHLLLLPGRDPADKAEPVRAVPPPARVDRQPGTRREVVGEEVEELVPQRDRNALPGHVDPPAANLDAEVVARGEDPPNDRAEDGNQHGRPCDAKNLRSPAWSELRQNCDDLSRHRRAPPPTRLSGPGLVA